MLTIDLDQLLSLAKCYHEAGQIDAAEQLYDRALAVSPTNKDVCHSAGMIALSNGKYKEAEDRFSRASAIDPVNGGFLNNLGVAQRLQGRSEAAASTFRKAVTAAPDSHDAYNNLGEALVDMARYEEAISPLRHALKLRPDFVEASLNLANAICGCGVVKVNAAKVEEAESDFREALRINSSLSVAHLNLALALHLQDRHEEAWREYEHRTLNPSHKPRWDGELVSGKTLLIRSEQGLGDTIQFLRYLPFVPEASDAARVILEVPASLVRVVCQSGDFGVEVVEAGSDVPPFDYHLPLMSLPFALGRYDPMEIKQPYLRATKGPMLDSVGLRVGLVWSGNPQHAEDRRRSIATDAMAPILSVEGATFYSLQLGQPAPEGVTDLTSGITDFADTAALMAELDLIITVDTAAAHLAGALGRPVWTLLPFVPDWRWGLEREDTPWYPTMRLFRQKTAGDWGEVIERVAGELVRLVG